MTNESKRNDDEKQWRTFLETYIERLKKEGDEDDEELQKQRIQIMKKNNPRYEKEESSYPAFFPLEKDDLIFRNGISILSMNILFLFSVGLYFKVAYRNRRDRRSVISAF